jgi:putative ABC transport system permease protein
MVRYLNWKNPIGKSLEIFEVRKGRVIGVVKDFNFASLRESVQPLAIVLSNNPLYVSIQLKPGTIAGTLPLIGKEWKKRVRDYPFDYFFLDEQINRFYQEDNRLLQAISVFALTAILIACMGLFGLSMYMVEQRTKEVGIRKVLGATVAGITIMLTKYFMRLMLIASLISFPLAWWAINNWLRDFAYRVYPGVGVFMIASFAASTIALFAVAFQAIRAAKANPVISLRSE